MTFPLNSFQLTQNHCCLVGLCVKDWRICLWCLWCPLISSSWSCWRRRRGRSWWSRWGRGRRQSTSVPSLCPPSMTFQVQLVFGHSQWHISACVLLFMIVISWILPSKASASVNIGQLEQQLILSLEPRRIRQILIELHGMAERPFWRVNSKVRGQQTEKNYSANIQDIQYFASYILTLDFHLFLYQHPVTNVHMSQWYCNSFNINLCKRRT